MLLITPTHQVLVVWAMCKVPIGQGMSREDARRIARAYNRLPNLGKYDMTGLSADAECENGSQRAEDSAAWTEQQHEQQLHEYEQD